ncbi:MAG: trypsin-like peptidase domain-containing protein [Burkholderiales bacterium]
MSESLLRACVQVSTFLGGGFLTRASGFLFARDGRTWLATSAHVVHDEAAGHLPDRVGVALHVDDVDLTRTVQVAVPLYANGVALWRQASDTGGQVDVAVVPLDAAALASSRGWEAFGPEHLEGALEQVEVGEPALVVGFPIVFHDTVHHLPVVRQAGIASAFGVRFQGQGYFLTDARTHRGTSGAPVVVRARSGPLAASRLPWRLLGVHASRMDMGTRDRDLDESLGLNAAWYADVLLALTRP